MLTLEKKILPQLLPGFELATFRSRVQRSTKKLFGLPRCNRHRNCLSVFNCNGHVCLVYNFVSLAGTSEVTLVKEKKAHHKGEKDTP